MVKLLGLIKKHSVKILIGIVLILLVTTFLDRSCNGRKVAELEGRLQAHKEEAKEKEEELMEAKAILESEGLIKDNKILDLKEEVTKSHKKEISHEKANRKNVTEIKKLKEEIETLTDTPLIIVNLKNQIVVLEDMNTNKDKRLFEAHKQIKDLNSALYISEQGKLEERQYRIKVEEQWAREVRLREIAEDINKEQKKKIRAVNFKLNLKSALYAGGGFLLGVVIGGR